MAGATQPRPVERGALPAIFAVFLGLMIAAVVGLGVYTFMPSPGDRTQQQVSELSEQREDILGCFEPAYTCRSYDDLTAAEKARYEQLTRQIDDLQEQADQERDAWAQRTAVVLIVLATALMALSLLLTESMVVLSNGILLGGLFTMLYGVGWAFASEQQGTRFAVLVVALLVSLGLGYLRFVRPRRAAASGAVPTGTGEAGSAAEPGAVAAVPSGERDELAARVAELERRLAAVADLLGPRDGSR